MIISENIFTYNPPIYILLSTKYCHQ